MLNDIIFCAALLAWAGYLYCLERKVARKSVRIKELEKTVNDYDIQLEAEKAINGYLRSEPSNHQEQISRLTRFRGLANK